MNHSVRSSMAEFASLEVSMWINKLNVNFKDALISIGLSCISFFHQIKVNEPLLCAAMEFWILTWHVFHFNSMELCSTLEQFSVIMGEYDFSAIILPIHNGDLSNLAHQLLRVPLAMAKRWCKSNKLNVFMVFKYFSKKDIPLDKVKRFYHLNTFCLYIPARFFLVLETPRVDPGIIHVVKQLGSGSSLSIILVETFKAWMSFIGRKQRSLQGVLFFFRFDP